MSDEKEPSLFEEFKKEMEPRGIKFVEEQKEADKRTLTVYWHDKFIYEWDLVRGQASPVEDILAEIETFFRKRKE